MTALLGTLVVLTLLLAPYLRAWSEQRSHIKELRAEVANSRKDVQHLQEQRRRWDDPEFVKAQARERLRFAMPGETSFVVVDKQAQTVSPDSSRPRAGVTPTQRPWFSDLWASVEAAGATP